MSEINYIKTVACIEALRHTEFIVEYFKLLKNGKELKLKLNLFLETVVYPPKLMDHEIEEFIKVFHISYFKNNMNLETKQKLTGFFLRMNSSDFFLSKVISFPLQNFTISPRMKELNELLQQYFKPIIIKIMTSKKSHSHSQIATFNNITFEKFETIKAEKLQLNRRMSKFEVWSVKNEHEQFSLNNVDNLDNRNSQNELLTFDNMVDENGENYAAFDTGNINIFTELDFNINTGEISQFFSSFCA